jgi:hypothetical protein
VIEEQTVSYANLSFEDFKLEWMLLFYPYWARPLLKRLKREREEEDQLVVSNYCCSIAD